MFAIKLAHECLHACMLNHFSRVQLFVILRTLALQAPLTWDSPSKNNGMGSHALLQGIFWTQGSNPCLMSPELAAGFYTIEAPGKTTQMFVETLFVIPQLGNNQDVLQINRIVKLENEVFHC